MKAIVHFKYKNPDFVDWYADVMQCLDVIDEDSIYSFMVAADNKYVEKYGYDCIHRSIEFIPDEGETEWFDKRLKLFYSMVKIALEKQEYGIEDSILEDILFYGKIAFFTAKEDVVIFLVGFKCFDVREFSDVIDYRNSINYAKRIGGALYEIDLVNGTMKEKT